MIYIYTEKSTHRVKFIIHQLFEKILHQSIAVFSKLEEMPTDPQTVRLAYTSKEVPEGVFRIVPQGLLFEKGLKQPTIQMGEWKGLKTFFPTAGDLPFDVLAASFYLITRYEEWIAPASYFSEYSGYDYTQSLAYQEGFLSLPLVDCWMIALEEELKQQFPAYEPSKKRSFMYRPLILIDNPYKYQNHWIGLSLYQLFKKLFTGHYHAFTSHFKAFTHLVDDPYCRTQNLVDMHNRNNVIPLFLMRTKFEKCLERPVYATFRKYRYVLSHNYMFGLRASVSASQSGAEYHKELRKLKKVTESEIRMSSFANACFTHPRSYHIIAKEGVKGDCSMYYAKQMGFRASTCTPFHYYDFDKEDYYKLKIHPVAVSDEKLRKLDISKTEIEQQVKALATTVKKVGGEFTTMIHNDTLMDKAHYHGWATMYESCLRYISLLEIKSIEEAVEGSK